MTLFKDDQPKKPTIERRSVITISLPIWLIVRLSQECERRQMKTSTLITEILSTVYKTRPTVSEPKPSVMSDAEMRALEELEDGDFSSDPTP